jgi:hypothetical protein
VAEIRVENRHTIRPWFWVPDGTLIANRQVTPENPVRNLADPVAHSVSYSNPEELRVRITRLARAAGWTS